MRRLKYAFAIVISMALLALPLKARADVNDFVITDFSGDYTLDNSDPQGQLHIIEKISVEFHDNNHGILRAIPKSYKGQSHKLKVNKVSSDSNAPSQYTTYAQSGNEVLKIGDPSRTVTGPQEYTIDYTLQNVITFYDDHDELYWDINGDQWQQPFQSVSATFHLPAGLTINDTKCFAGSFGTTSQSCTTEKLAPDIVKSNTTKPLAAYETLTSVQSFAKGYFKPVTTTDWLRDHWTKLASVAGPPVIVGLWAFRRWLKYGKDLKGRGVIVPEYAPPDKLLPAEVGMLYDYKVDAKDVSATIIDLAIKKHLRIIEEKQKKLLKDKTIYYFKRLASDTSGLSAYEMKVLNGIFPSLTEGTEVKLDSLKNKFYTTVSSVQSSVPKSLTDKGYFASNPTKAGNRLLFTAIGLFVGAWIIHTWISIGFLLAAAIAFGFSAFMPRRSVKGVLAKDAIEGLKMYMDVAEKDRIKMLQSVDAKYAPQTHEPKKTVELFEKLLPFAIVLGVEGSWAEQFKDIYTNTPDWYSGNWNSFNAVYFASSLNNSVSAMSTNFSPPNSSGSSGFGGGGFSGGGGGGGGGGGW